MMLYKRKPKEVQLILFFCFVKFVLLLFALNNYGFHRDELLYMAMGKHLDWGYMEVPPFVAGVAWFSSFLFGDSLIAIRIIPAMASILIVGLSGLLVLLMNGKRLAIIATCSALIISPAFLASGYLFQPVVFDQLFWVLAAYLTVKHIQTHQNIYIYLLGVTTGVGMLNKYTMAFFVVALITALLISQQRKLLLNRVWLYAFFIAFIIFLPNLIWQINHNFPFFAHMRELKKTQLNHINSGDFLIQLLTIHATASMVWLMGLFYIFTGKSNRRYIILGISFILLLAILFLLQGKVYYSFGAFPMLFAAGGICIQKALNRLRPLIQYSIIAVCLAPTAFLIPIAVPILNFGSVLKLFELTSKSGLSFIVKWEDQKEHATTQDYADMLGWEDMAQYVSKAYHSIPVNEQSETTIFADNYGQAGAISHFRTKYNLPEPISLSSSFALWSPESFPRKYIIIITDDVEDIAKAYGNNKKIGVTSNPYAREKGTGIYLLSNPKLDILPYYSKIRMEALNY